MMRCRKCRRFRMRAGIIADNSPHYRHDSSSSFRICSFCILCNSVKPFLNSMSSPFMQMSKSCSYAGRYNISAERAFLQSIRECRAETVILFEHLRKALASLKEDTEAAGEAYKYEGTE